MTILILTGIYITTQAFDIGVSHNTASQNTPVNIDISENITFSNLTTFSWYTSPWSQCSGRCTVGTQYRTVLCKGSDNKYYTGPNEAACTQAKPVDVRKCGGQCRNIALGRYSHSNTYNYPRANNGVTWGGGRWDGLTDGSTNSNEGIWAGGLTDNRTKTPYVSIDLGGTKTVDRIVVKNAGGSPYYRSGNFSKSIRIQTKSSGSCSAGSGGWRTVKSTGLGSGSSTTHRFSNLTDLRCVRIHHTNAGDSWAGYSHYSFLAELEVYGY